jgi:hypothetical protein
MKIMAEEEKSKMQSRKFVVWVAWLVLAVAIIVSSTVIMVILHEVNDILVTTTEKVLSWFFYISMMYLGVNVGQKAVFALSDALKKKQEEETNE